jgi:hypothetical protein
MSKIHTAGCALRSASVNRIQALARRRITRRLASTSCSVVAHDDTLIRIAVRPCHSVPPHQQVPAREPRRSPRAFVPAIRMTRPLVDDHLVENLRACADLDGARLAASPRS